MLFKDLKVGDTLYVKNPIHWAWPIKKTIDKIVPFGTDGTRLDFYAENDEFLGAAMPDRSQGIGIGSMIFADFEAFKKYWVDYHTKNVEKIQKKMQKVVSELNRALDDLAKVSLMEEND